MRQPVARTGRRWVTHPLAPTAVLLPAAAGVLAWAGLGGPQPTLAWVVLALAAGYSVSGSV